MDVSKVQMKGCLTNVFDDDAGLNGQIDRAVAVHGVVEGLQLDPCGSIDMETNRTLTPDAINLILQELLLAHDKTFELRRMSTISKLECGVVTKSGECIWANRSEINARHPEIRLIHDYVTSSAPPAPTPESIVAHTSASVISQPSAEDLTDMLDRMHSDVEETKPMVHPRRRSHTSVAFRRSMKEARLCILGAEDVRRVVLAGNQQSPYCEWRLLNPSQEEVAFGRTEPHESGGRGPNWSHQPFLVPLPPSLTSLMGCTMLFRVKTPVIGGIS